jgi:hypothetical protein
MIKQTQSQWILLLRLAIVMSCLLLRFWGCVQLTQLTNIFLLLKKFLEFFSIQKLFSSPLLIINEAQEDAKNFQLTWNSSQNK